MAGKYTPLEHFLRDFPASQREVTMSFEQIERILNVKLAPSAYEYQAWWANEKDPHQPEKQAIANAGWRVNTINLHEKWVRFVRQLVGILAIAESILPDLSQEDHRAESICRKIRSTGIFSGA